MRKHWTLALGATLLVAGAYAVTGSTSALGAETHSDCATFDSTGNITSVTPNCSETVHAPASTVTFDAANPCTGAPGTVELDDSHSVFHVNVNGDGDAWVTGTDGGPASFTPDSPTDASGQGTWTSWFGGALDNRSSVMSSTFTVRISLSDGSHVTMHDNSHATLTPNGVVLGFDHPTLSCGG